MKPSKGIFEHNSSVFHVEILHIGISEKIEAETQYILNN